MFPRLRLSMSGRPCKYVYRLCRTNKGSIVQVRPARVSERNLCAAKQSRRPCMHALCCDASHAVCIALYIYICLELCYDTRCCCFSHIVECMRIAAASWPQSNDACANKYTRYAPTSQCVSSAPDQKLKCWSKSSDDDSLELVLERSDSAAIASGVMLLMLARNWSCGAWRSLHVLLRSSKICSSPTTLEGSELLSLREYTRFRI